MTYFRDKFCPAKYPLRDKAQKTPSLFASKTGDVQITKNCQTINIPQQEIAAQPLKIQNNGG